MPLGAQRHDSCCTWTGDDECHLASQQTQQSGAGDGSAHLVHVRTAAGDVPDWCYHLCLLDTALITKLLVSSLTCLMHVIRKKAVLCVLHKFYLLFTNCMPASLLRTATRCSLIVCLHHSSERQHKCAFSKLSFVHHS